MSETQTSDGEENRLPADRTVHFGRGDMVESPTGNRYRVMNIYYGHGGVPCMTLSRGMHTIYPQCRRIEKAINDGEWRYFQMDRGE